jgi:predicted dehydrogenase
MTPSGKIRVGVIGANATQGFARVAHMPALQALSDFAVVAVCTTREESASAAAKAYGAKYALTDAEELARHPEVDLVTVSVRVPAHYKPVMAAIEAGKHIFCEWPLGRSTVEAEQMLAAAQAKGVRHMVGLQGRALPAIAYARDLIADGYIGRVLSATVVGCSPSWGPIIDTDMIYQADSGNGANLLTITGGHTLDALCYCLGEFRELTAFVVNQRERVPLRETGEIIAKTSPDQLVVSGIIGDGAAISCQVRGGVKRGTHFLFEIHGEAGDLVLTSTTRNSVQRQELNLQGARGDVAALADLPIPAKYRWVPDAISRDSAYNVAQLYGKLAGSIRNGTPASPDFAAAVMRHRLLDMIVRAAETGQKQTA